MNGSAEAGIDVVINHCESEADSSTVDSDTQLDNAWIFLNEDLVNNRMALIAIPTAPPG